jgi:hypothetical protein
LLHPFLPSLPMPTENQHIRPRGVEARDWPASRRADSVVGQDHGAETKDRQHVWLRSAADHHQ